MSQMLSQLHLLLHSLLQSLLQSQFYSLPQGKIMRCDSQVDILKNYKTPPHAPQTQVLYQHSCCLYHCLSLTIVHRKCLYPHKNLRQGLRYLIRMKYKIQADPQNLQGFHSCSTDKCKALCQHSCCPCCCLNCARTLQIFVSLQKKR